MVFCELRLGLEGEVGVFGISFGVPYCSDFGGRLGILFLLCPVF